MSYTSYGFLMLVLISLLLYYSFRGGFQNLVLLFASILFILWAGGLSSLFFIALSAAISFLAGIAMDRAQAGRKKAVYVLAMLAQGGMLAVFKYLNFPGYTMLALHELRGLEYEFMPMELAAPLGISFYALMQMGYLTDVYWGRIPHASSPVSYGVFSSLFLHIVQGPIDRYGQLAGPLSERRRFQAENLLNGLTRLLWGLFKKLVLSERLAVFVNAIYGDLEVYNGSYLVFAAICYSLQLYTDFSGCMDMVLGTGELFGIRLTENFKQPFFSRSDAEFWRRWHISLGNWFRDYLMYPLLRTEAFKRLGKLGKKLFGKKQGKKLPLCVGLFIVWFLLGLWHGGMWTFIIGSGLLHCTYMILAEIFEPAFQRFYKATGLNRENPIWRAFQMLRTFVLVSAGFVFFRSDSLTMAFQIFRGMGTPNGGLFTAEGFWELGMAPADLWVLVLGLLLLFAVSRKLEQTEEIASVGMEEGRDQASFGERLLAVPLHRAIFATALFLMVVLWGFYGQGYDAASFIYSRF